MWNIQHTGFQATNTFKRKPEHEAKRRQIQTKEEKRARETLQWIQHITVCVCA